VCPPSAPGAALSPTKRRTTARPPATTTTTTTTTTAAAAAATRYFYPDYSSTSQSPQPVDLDVAVTDHVAPVPQYAAAGAVADTRGAYR